MRTTRNNNNNSSDNYTNKRNKNYIYIIHVIVFRVFVFREISDPLTLLRLVVSRMKLNKAQNNKQRISAQAFHHRQRFVN